MRLLDLDDLLYVARRAIGAVEVRDVGLLEAAVARPAATVFGDDAYPTDHDKAAAFVHSIARNHALVDGNKRLAFAGLFALLGLNGERIVATDDEAYDVIVAIAAGDLDDVGEIAAWLDLHTEPTTFSAPE